MKFSKGLRAEKAKKEGKVPREKEQADKAQSSRHESKKSLK